MWASGSTARPLAYSVKVCLCKKVLRENSLWVRLDRSCTSNKVVWGCTPVIQTDAISSHHIKEHLPAALACYRQRRDHGDSGSPAQGHAPCWVIKAQWDITVLRWKVLLVEWYVKGLPAIDLTRDNNVPRWARIESRRRSTWRLRNPCKPLAKRHFEAFFSDLRQLGIYNETEPLSNLEVITDD